MKLISCLASFGLLVFTSRAGTQEEPVLAKAGAKHALLKDFEGTWDVTGKFWPEKDGPPLEGKFTQTAKLRCNGLWLIYSTQGELGGKPYEGHGVMGWNEQKGKYVDTYVDVRSDSLDTFEGTWDDATKTLTLTWEGVSAEGAPLRFKTTAELKDPDTQVMTSYDGPERKDRVSGRWDYKRRK
jgi:hypothetical protein